MATAEHKVRTARYTKPGSLEVVRRNRNSGVPLQHCSAESLHSPRPSKQFVVLPLGESNEAVNREDECDSGETVKSDCQMQHASLRMSPLNPAISFSSLFVQERQPDEPSPPVARTTHARRPTEIIIRGPIVRGFVEIPCSKPYSSQPPQEERPAAQSELADEECGAPPTTSQIELDYRAKHFEAPILPTDEESRAEMRKHELGRRCTTVLDKLKAAGFAAMGMFARNKTSKVNQKPVVKVKRIEQDLLGELREKSEVLQEVFYEMKMTRDAGCFWEPPLMWRSFGNQEFVFRGHTKESVFWGLLDACGESGLRILGHGAHSFVVFGDVLQYHVKVFRVPLWRNAYYLKVVSLQKNPYSAFPDALRKMKKGLK